MKLIRFKSLKFKPASHENVEKPGVLKKVLIDKSFELSGDIQMVNWSYIVPGKSFQKHFHESMDEIFIVLSGSASIIVATERAELQVGDAVVVPAQVKHVMKNIGEENLEYLVIGIAKGTNGKTIVT